MQRHRRAFTLLEIIIVLGIILMLLAILLPALEKAREQAMQLKCASNLHTIGQTLAIYCNENHGSLPRTRYVPGAPLAFGTNGAAPDPFAASGPVPNDVTAAVFLLIRNERLPSELLTCPYDDVNQWQPDRAPALGSRSNFTDYTKNLGYSFANPYPDAAVAAAGYTWTNHMPAGMALAADMNPGTGKTENSENHEERGQNVLYADGHVQWESSTKVGIADDNIFVNRNGVVVASPADASDSVLLPAQK